MIHGKDLQIYWKLHAWNSSRIPSPTIINHDRFTGSLLDRNVRRGKEFIIERFSVTPLPHCIWCIHIPTLHFLGIPRSYSKCRHILAYLCVCVLFILAVYKCLTRKEMISRCAGDTVLQGVSWRLRGLSLRDTPSRSKHRECPYCTCRPPLTFIY